MKDLIKVLKHAKENYPKISSSEIHHFCDDTNKINNEISYDWDEWCGEDWITITLKNRRVLMIGVKIPVAFVTTSVFEYIQSFELMRKLYVVTINDFDDIIWSLDLDEFKNVFSYIDWHASDDAVDTTSFSTNDFWFATI